MTRTSRPVTVTLGAHQERVEARVASGAYESVSEVVRAGLRALDREEADLDAWARARIEAYETDPRPPVPWDEAKARLKAYHEARVKVDAAKA